MGIGDEIMVTGEVKRLAAGTAKRFAICSQKYHGKQIWYDIWAGNPRIARVGEEFDAKLFNAAGQRPYIAFKGGTRWTWQPYKPEPGELFLTEGERAFGRKASGTIIIQPGIKANASPNKQWPLRYWETLVKENPDIDWLQIGDGSEPRIAGASFLLTETFRLACAALEAARSAVLQEGGLHHAAAALGKQVVVIFGGFISPRVTGYQMHRNLFVESEDFPLGCGMRIACKHCRRALELITPEKVMAELKEATR